MIRRSNDAFQPSALDSIRLESGIDESAEEIVGEDAILVLGGIVGGVLVRVGEGRIVIESLDEGVEEGLLGVLLGFVGCGHFHCRGMDAYEQAIVGSSSITVVVVVVALFTFAFLLLLLVLELGMELDQFIRRDRSRGAPNVRRCFHGIDGLVVQNWYGRGGKFNDQVGRIVMGGGGCGNRPPLLLMLGTLLTEWSTVVPLVVIV
mmetsp:Transcript_378/g.874  ORF Transcript_378/g.874 Transcript_378/m.874 type:complete len:205 (+) Transcript_378:1919-2533(+)